MKKQEEIDIDIIRTEWAHSMSYNPDGWELAVGEFDRAIAKIKAEAWEKGAQAGYDLASDDAGAWINLHDYPDELPEEAINPYKEK